jgi:HAD superfamily hydrolase (TIGR01509 family)
MSSFAVIFDMDGVIIDSNPFHKISLRLFCEKYGFHLSDEELIKKIYGRTNKEWIANLFGALSKEELSRFGEEKESLFREVYKNDIRSLEGLPGFLESLKEKNIPMAIGTSAPRSNVDFVLSHTGLEGFFSAILDESDVEHGKPNPEIYLKVAAKLGFEPAQSVVFEDSLSGIESARRAGAKVVGVATTHSAEELRHTDFVIKDFAGLDPDQLFAAIFKKY